MGFATARASAESVPSLTGMAKTEAETVSAAGEVIPRLVQPSAVATEIEKRATNILGSRKAVNPYTWLVCAKIVKIIIGKGEPTQDSMLSAGHEPT